MQKKTTRKKTALLLVLALLIAPITGCWSRIEVENLAISTMVGIDKVNVKGEEVYRFSAKILRTGQLGLGQGGQGGLQRPPSWLVTGLGSTVFDASRNLFTRSPRRAFHAHSKFIVIGEKVAQEGMQEVIDFFLRNREIRLRNWIIISKGEAVTFMQSEPELEKLLNEELQGLIEESLPITGKAVAVDLKEFAAALATPGRDIAVAKMELIIPPEESNEVEIQKTFGVGPSQHAAKSERLSGAAIFKEGKLVGYIGDSEARGLLFVLGEIKGGIIPINLPKDKFSFEITRSETEVKSNVKNGQVTFEVKVNLEGDIAEQLTARKISTDQISKHQEAVANSVKKQIEKIISIAQQDFGADIFGFGEEFRRQHNSKWKKVKGNWREVFAAAKTEVKVDAKIRRTGMVSDPLMAE